MDELIRLFNQHRIRYLLESKRNAARPQDTLDIVFLENKQEADTS